VVELIDESDLFEWRIWIEGPKDTPYEGGVFQLVMKFPSDYPMSPPELKFISDFWHPNVYKESNIVCISILHPPVEDEMSGELPEERWLPTQTVTTILLSVISLLSAPNFSSPANVDASVEWRNFLDAYKARCKRLVEKSIQETPSHVVIPHPDTNPEERAKQIAKLKETDKPIDDDLDDFMNDDNMYPEDAEDEEASEQEEDNSHSSKEDKKTSTKKKKQKTKAKKQVSVIVKETKSKGKKEKGEMIREGEASSKGQKKKKCSVM